MRNIIGLIMTGTVVVGGWFYAQEMGKPSSEKEREKISPEMALDRYRAELEKLPHKIAFVDGGKSTRIWVMDAAGTNLKKLCDQIRYPIMSLMWSPDGQKIVFQVLEKSCIELWLMEANGLKPRRLAKHAASPSWSPDSKKIAFEMEEALGSLQIQLLRNINIKNMVNLSRNKLDNRSPAWSPDGSKIAFLAGGAKSKYEVYVMDIDGGNQAKLTMQKDLQPAPWKRPLHWSPDGKKLLVELVNLLGQPPRSEIYVMDADGGNQINLTNHPAIDEDPSWSPDGKKAAFMSDRDGNWEIYVMDLETKNLTRLTNNNAMDSSPRWSPDGNHIAFVSDRDEPRRKEI